MRKQLIARGGALLAAALFLYLLCGYLLFPTAKIDALVSELLAPQGLSISPAVHKTVLPGLAWDNMQLASAQGTLLQCDQLRIRLLLLPLLRGKLVCSAAAGIGAGHLDVKYALNGSDAVKLDADGIALDSIPFFKNALGAQVAGTLWGRGDLQRAASGLTGDVKLEVKQLNLAGVKLGAFPLPDAANLKTQGMIKVAGGKARLESFTLEGEGIYMRLSGDLPVGGKAGMTPLAMSLEIMPKPEFLEKQKLVFMLLAKFMASPGVYRIPIRGTLLKPEIL